MAKLRTYNCPECGGQFSHLHHPSTDTAPPRFCPLCGYDTQSEERAAEFSPAITAPMIGTNKAKAGDATYRMMEAEAQSRIEAAAEMTGQPESDFADMKITDLKDNLREGDTAAVAMPANDVTRRMAEMQARGMPVGFAGGEAYAQTTGQGPEPYAGLRTSQMLRRAHAAAGGLVTDSPALEVVRRGNAGPGS